MSLVHGSVAGVPSKVADRFLPVKFLPITVPSEPDTIGVCVKVAAFNTEDTVTVGTITGGGGGGGAAATVRVKESSGCRRRRR